jgi:hypothetical protein
MAVTSPNAQLFLAVQERLKEKATGVNWVDQNFGQLDNFDIKPAVNFPCALIDITGLQYEDLTNGAQKANGRIVITIGTTPFTNSSAVTPVSQREKAIQYYEIEHAVHKALHNWVPVPGFEKLLRRNMDKQEREDAIRERVVVFDCGYRDCGAVLVKTRIATPMPVIGGDALLPT